MIWAKYYNSHKYASNYESSVVPPLAYNCKHVHMYIVVLTPKVIYVNIINHAYRHTVCVYNL